MDDDMLLRGDPGDLDVERRLRAYADFRLTPSAADTSRMRNHVMDAAHRRAALLAADVRTAEPGAAAATRDPRRFAWRRPVAAALAACLTLGMLAGTVYGSRPGGPFYAARLWTEMATLPASGAARAQAEVVRLESRLREAQEASASGDVAGATAALEAYASIVEEAALWSRGDAAATSALETGLERHVSVLSGLAANVPAQAAGAIQHALSSSTKVLDHGDGGPTPGGGGAGGAGGPGGPGAPGGGPSQTGGPPDKPVKATPAAPGKPDTTLKPAATARPTDPRPDPSKKP